MTGKVVTVLLVALTLAVASASLVGADVSELQQQQQETSSSSSSSSLPDKSSLDVAAESGSWLERRARRLNAAAGGSAAATHQRHRQRSVKSVLALATELLADEEKKASESSAAAQGYVFGQMDKFTYCQRGGPDVRFVSYMCTIGFFPFRYTPNRNLHRYDGVCDRFLHLQPHRRRSEALLPARLSSREWASTFSAGFQHHFASMAVAQSRN